MRTLFEPLPEKWENKPLKSLSRVLRRGKSPVYSEEYQGLMVINQDCIRWDGVELDKAKYYVSSEASTIPEELFLSENDILLNSTGTGTIGRVSIWKWKDQRAVLDSHVTLIRINPTLANPFYVKYLLSSELGQRYLEAFCYTGSTNQIELSKRYLSKLEIPLPPDNEQGIIASILSKVDEAIDATKETIAKAERLKKALMQNLLTGKLRPDGTWRKEEDFYTDEQFGKVPKGWKVDRFKKFAVLQRGKDLTDNEVIPGPYPVVKSNGVQIHHNQFICEPPGVVTGRSGTIGKVFYIEENYWPHNTSLYIKDFKGNNEKYIFYLINTMKFEQYYAGTTVPTLNRNDIHKVRVAVPESKDEQLKIVNFLDKADNILSYKQTKIQTLERLKKALMQNLLTGKVRVKIEK